MEEAKAPDVREELWRIQPPFDRYSDVFLCIWILIQCRKIDKTECELATCIDSTSFSADHWLKERRNKDFELTGLYLDHVLRSLIGWRSYEHFHPSAPHFRVSALILIGAPRSKLFFETCFFMSSTCLPSVDSMNSICLFFRFLFWQEGHPFLGENS